MRTVNSQIARIINKHFDRDSQALRERYKSPIITTTKYLKLAIKYIWVNRIKTNKDVRPDQDKFCSVYWRLHKPYKFKESPSNKKEQEENLLAMLLDSYEKIDLCKREDEDSLVRSWLEEALQEVDLLLGSLFKSAHTIGDAIVVAFRAQYLAAYRRERAPP